MAAQAERYPGADAEMTENYVTLRRGGLFYLAAGPADGPLIVFVHGWPELSISWRHQLPVFGQLGFRAVAIDLPGFGRSALHTEHGDYSMENIVGDLVEFLAVLGRDRAVWVGHDWGSAVVWSLASHHPERCDAVCSLCVPYRTVECGLEALIDMVDRSIYPADEHPAGQWDYMLFYRDRFDDARTTFERDTTNFFKAFMTRGDPELAGKPLITAGVCARGGWFGGDAPPPSEIDRAVLDEVSLSRYAAAFARTGFFGGDSLYMNHAPNAEYTARADNGGYLDMPVLFVLAENDHWCECIRNAKFAEAMLDHCRDFTAVTVAAGHWISQEKPTEVNGALARWLATSARVWPTLPTPKWTR